MLSPDYYEHCADTIIEQYAELENAIVSDIVRRIIKTGVITDSADWQIKQLQKIGLLYDDVLSEIAKRTNATENHVRALFEDAGIKAVAFDNAILMQAGLIPIGIRQSPAMLQVLNAGFKKTLGVMNNLTLTTANTSQTAYYNACNSAYMKVTSGAFSYQEAIRQAIKQTAQDGATVLYPSGHTDKIDVAVRRSVLTGVGQTCRTISETNARENDCDLMEITAHSGARPSHAEWQGQIVSLSKRKGYLTKDDIGYGSGDGFGGWNCRHDWFPYFEGISSRNYTPKDLENLNAKNIEYNGKKYSEYEVSQMQRSQERKIRGLKREAVTYDTALKNTADEALKTAFKDDFNTVSKRLKEHEGKLKDLLSETGRQRDRFREQTTGFNHSVSSKAVWANKKSDSSIQYMSRFTPRYSNSTNLKTGTLNIPVKVVSNSRFTMYTDISANRKDKAVKLIEKSVYSIARQLPKEFKMPAVAVINFENNSINPNAIGGYDKTTGIMYINSKYDTKEKILTYVNATQGQFANKTELAPILHELGHKYYEDSINSLAISKNMSYNDVKKQVDRRIYNYVEINGGKDFIEKNLSTYAQEGFNHNEYTEIIAECFSVKNENKVAKEILKLLGDD